MWFSSFRWSNVHLGAVGTANRFRSQLVRCLDRYVFEYFISVHICLPVQREFVKWNVSWTITNYQQFYLHTASNFNFPTKKLHSKLYFVDVYLISEEIDFLLRANAYATKCHNQNIELLTGPQSRTWISVLCRKIKVAQSIANTIFDIII